MGSFAQRLTALQREKRQLDQAERAAKKVAWPNNADGSKFAGTVMWCPKCYGEIHRIPEGTECSPFEQRQLVDAHRAKCPRERLRAV